MPSTIPAKITKILILGDGNFSFSLSLLSQLQSKDEFVFKENGYLAAGNDEKVAMKMDQAKMDQAEREAGSMSGSMSAASTRSSTYGPQNQTFHVTATSFDSKDQVIEKYRDSPVILEKIESRFASRGLCTVLHNVNAWELQSHFGDCKFDFIIWNHPHLGTEDFRLHSFLMAHFFNSCISVLNYQSNPGATVRLSLVQGQESRWDVFKQAEKNGLLLDDIRLFNELDWPGYVVKRNKHGGSFKNLHTKRHVRTVMKSCVYSWKFGGDVKAGMEVKSKYGSRQDIHEYLCHLFGEYFNSIFSQKSLLPAGVPSDLTPAKIELVPFSSSGVAGDSSSLTSSDGTVVKSGSVTLNARKLKRLVSVPVDFKCIHCNKQLSNPRSYNQHVHTVHELCKFGKDWAPDRPKNLACPKEGCSKMFADAEALQQHQINKHSSISASELPDALHSQDGDASHIQAEEEYGYFACHICGQACVDQPWGMELHLESLKPALGMNMHCPICLRRDATTAKGFIESRALIQHYKFCRARCAVLDQSDLCDDHDLDAVQTKLDGVRI